MVRFATLIVLVVTVWLLQPLAVRGQSPFSGPPPLIRMTGVFLHPDGKIDKSYPTLDVSILDQTHTFSVHHVESLTDARQGWAILRNLGAVLTLTGPAELIRQLQNLDVPVQLVAIEGRLYVKQRRLIVTAVMVSPVYRQ